jgi:hypothetical protein
MKQNSWIFLLILALVGCNLGKGQPGVYVKSEPDNTFQGNEKINWVLMKSTVLSTCLNCHSARQSPDLSTLVAFVAVSATVWSEVDTKSMPPAGSGQDFLNDCKKAVLRKWLDLGTPENSEVLISTVAECSSGVGPAPTPIKSISDMPVNYQTLHDRILAPRCLHCHNAADTTNAAAILFSPYSELMAGVRRWSKPADMSKIIKVLKSIDPDVRMPPPETGAALTSEEMVFIKKWIEAGWPEF